MAKLKKRIISGKNKKQRAAGKADNGQLKEKMQSLVAEKKYADAMDVMAEIARTGIMDSETMYLGALCYFRTEDYERAARWTIHVLEKDGANYRARLLLVHICMAKDRVQDGLDILEDLLAADEERLTADEREELIDELYYFRYTDQEMLAKCPRTRKLLGIEDSEAPKEKADHIEAADPIARHKAENTPDNENAARDGQSGKEKDMQEADKIIEDILSREISLKEKVKLLNNFAAGCYLAEDYAGCYALLAAALRIDSQNEAVVCNMAYTCIAMQDMDKALAFAAKMPMADFACINAIKNKRG